MNIKKLDYVSKRYIKLYEPLFIKPVITWKLHFKTKRRRDWKNFMGGLKWLEDCLVDMNILHDDSIERFENEFYEVIIDKNCNGKIEILIEEKESQLKVLGSL